MKKYVIALIFLTCFNQSIFAEDAPLRVAIPSFAPPFVMQDSLNQYYGFDIASMEYICRNLNRRCEYLPMNADDLIPALKKRQADIAIGGIVITIQKGLQVLFSTPYMVSQAQFITTSNAPFTSPFEIEQLKDQRIGVLNGSAFEEMVARMKLYPSRIITFERNTDMIQALNANTIDVVLLGQLQANYWQLHSNNRLKTIGRPFPVGLGFSIAVTQSNKSFLPILNDAVIQYQESKDYIRNYNLYIPEKF
ncbi:MAG: transporter substrate-binding domain-containing protein [Legionellaceae bacterium]|nr:transporter substrate-binding domain-containing protein [Legionellaceae bacterium]